MNFKVSNKFTKKRAGALAFLIIVLVLGIYLARKEEALKSEQANPNLITHKDPHLSPADLAIAQKRLADAERLVSDLNEKSTEAQKQLAYMQLGAAQYILGNLAEAKDAYQNAVNTGVRQDDSLYGLFLVQTEMFDNINAEQSIKNAIEISPQRSDLWRNFIQFEKDKIYRSDGELESLFTDAIQKTHNSPDMLSFYAEFLESIGDKQGAINVWNTAISVDPKRTSMYQTEIIRLQAK